MKKYKNKIDTLPHGAWSKRRKKSKEVLQTVCGETFQRVTTSYDDYWVRWLAKEHLIHKKNLNEYTIYKAAVYKLHLIHSAVMENSPWKTRSTVFLIVFCLRIMGYHFSSWLTATLNLCSIYLKLLMHVL